MDAKARRAIRQQLDLRLGKLRNTLAHGTEPPHGGWISALRRALGLTRAQLAARMNATQSAVMKFEANEVRGAISLSSLRRVADALDAELIYFLVPRKSLRATVEQRANQIARTRIEPLSHSMDLEAQRIPGKALEARIKAYAEELVDRPRELWR